MRLVNYFIKNGPLAVALLASSQLVWAALTSTPVYAKEKSPPPTQTEAAPERVAKTSPKSLSKNLNDSDIAQIVVTANTIDINAATLAKSKTKNPEVKGFAQRMITEHSSVNKQASDLANKLKLTPTENPTSTNLKNESDQTMATLKTLKGPSFDQEYILHEVDFHQAVLDTIDNSLLPNTKNEELKTLIIQVRPVIADHLIHAKKIQTSVKRGITG